VSNTTIKPDSARAGHRVVRALISLAAAALTILASHSASAQQATFYLDRLQVSGQPDDGLVLWRPYLHEKTRFYAHAALGYALNPLRVENLTSQPNIQDRLETPVSSQLVLHPTVGAEFGGRFAVGLSWPINLVMAGGQDPLADGIGNGLQRNDVAMHDLRLTAKVRVYQSDNRKLQLGLGTALFLPTGSATSFASDGETTGYIYGSIEYDFGKFQLVGNLGPHFRPARGIHGPDGELDIGTELRYAVGVFYPLRQGNIRLGGTIWGTLGLDDGQDTRSNETTFFNGRNTDVEWLVEARFALWKKGNVFANGGAGTRLSSGYGGPDLRLIASIGGWLPLGEFSPQEAPRRRYKPPDVEMHDKDTDGDGYPDDIDQCPTEKEDGKKPDPDDGCPAPKDRDGDGIPDDVDKCPNDPEDKDGIMDDDGCPEKDADNDGIPDTEDACPLVPGVKNKDPKKNGCKEEHTKIVETSSGIQLLEPIQFDTGRATIKPGSYPILDEVVDALKSRGTVRMGVYGHTDSRGAAQMNRNLSKERARAVVNYLVSHGIDRGRLESDGFGPDKPIDTNDTEEGRSKNRRVEFKVLE
jgi:outer membrane protein OmpA-like peptidoglycan-associated protein